MVSPVVGIVHCPGIVDIADIVLLPDKAADMASLLEACP
jgi:hypothetical protein